MLISFEEYDQDSLYCDFAILFCACLDYICGVSLPIVVCENWLYNLLAGFLFPDIDTFE